MKILRLLFIGASIVAAVAVVCVVLVSHWPRSQPTSNGLPKLAAAVHAYSRDHRSRGLPLPSSVTVRELVSSGYISSEDVRTFDGMDVTIYPTALDSDPSSILIRVRLANGSQIAALADGSIRDVPK